MGESARHQELVASIVGWIRRQYAAIDAGHILVDRPDAGVQGRPLPLGGHVPDVFVPSVGSQGAIVGEAKTGRDVESPRTAEQLRAFLTWLCCSPGSVLVVAVPWNIVPSARCVVRLLRSRCGADGVDVVVLDHL